MKRITTTDFRDYRRDRFIDAQTTPAARLAPTYMLTNEMGVDGDICEELTPASCAKVEFDIPSANLKGAELLFYVNADKSTADKPMRLQVNGHVLTHRQDRQLMLTGGWDRKKIAAKYLKDGTNEFVFSHSGVLHIDPFPGGLADEPSGRSSRSFDGGKTWHQGTLGEARAIEGEYLVRLRIKGHPPQGTLCSPVIDLADEEGSGRIAPRLGIRRLHLKARMRQPQGTQIHFELRTGSTPSFDPRTWTAWERSTALQWSGRFAQWRAILETDSANKTPTLQAVTLEADIEEDAQEPRPLQAGRIRPTPTRVQLVPLRLYGAAPAPRAAAQAVPPRRSDRRGQNRTRTTSPVARLGPQPMAGLAIRQISPLPLLEPARSPRHHQRRLGLRHVYPLRGGFRRLRLIPRVGGPLNRR